MENKNQTKNSVSNFTNLLEFFHIVENLKKTKRTGWIQFNIKNPESISDHMYRMSILALLLNDDDLDKNKCVKMAVVHDLAEGIVGDISPAEGITKEEKHRREMEAMQHICKELLGNSLQSQEIFSLWQEYENGETMEAKFVKDLDKFEMILQAFEYEKSDKKDLSEFFETTRGKFNHPLVKSWVEELYLRRETLTN